MKRMLIQFYFKYVVLNVCTSVECFHSTIQPALNRSAVKHTSIGGKKWKKCYAIETQLCNKV